MATKSVLRRACHWGPITAISIISVVTVTSTYSAVQLWALPHVVMCRWPWGFVAMYSWLFLIFKNFVQAMRGPGYVPIGWKPEEASDEEFLQYCKVCQGYKAPRSHHCRLCKRCIKKMDHHCPWINSCVGHENQPAFVRFLFYVPLGCIHGIVLNVNFLYRLFSYEFYLYPPPLPISRWALLFSIAGIGAAIGTTIGVFILFAVQLNGVLRNQTQIEDWIMEKARSRRKRSKAKPFVFPYNLGCWRNLTQVINRSGAASGNGLVWPLRAGCDRYSFTMEQLEQKKEKRQIALDCRVVRGYGGTHCPLGMGLMTCLCAPKCDEGKIKVEEGDTVSVTRWQTYWVYGDKQIPEDQTDKGVRVRGWFPRKCLDLVDMDKRRKKKKND